MLPECTLLAENEPNVTPVLNEVEVVSATEIWLAGQCGRVWRYDGTNLVEFKSQTDGHVWGMSITPLGDRGYLALQRRTTTSTGLVRYQ